MSAVDFKRIRENYSLASFFENEMGGKPKMVSGEVRYSTCPNSGCGESSDQSVKVSIRGYRWHCFACESGGDVIEAVSMYHGKCLSEAADYLTGECEVSEPRIMRQQAKPVEKRNDAAIQEVIAKLFSMDLPCDDGVAAYLDGRGIPRELTEAAIKRKVMINLPSDPNVALRALLDGVGKDLLMESGIWKKDSKTPAIIYRPLAFVSQAKDGIEFRLIADNSVATAKAIRYGEPSPCVWKGNEHVMITEGFIDMLSAVVLGSERTIFGIPGAKNWKEDAQWINDLPGKHVLIALDNDEAGVQGKAELQQFLQSIKANPKIYNPPNGLKDLNDQLRSLAN
jgi:hypothetical protein